MVGCGSAGHTTQCERATSSTRPLGFNCRSLGVPASTSLGELAGGVITFQLVSRPAAASAQHEGTNTVLFPFVALIVVDSLEDSDATIYYAHDDINGNPAYEVVSTREVVAQCRDSNRPRKGQRIVTDMEAGHAQRLCEALSSLALNGSTTAALRLCSRHR